MLVKLRYYEKNTFTSQGFHTRIFVLFYGPWPMTKKEKNQFFSKRNNGCSSYLLFLAYSFCQVKLFSPNNVLAHSQIYMSSPVNDMTMVQPQGRHIAKNSKPHELNYRVHNILEENFI